MIQSLNRTWLAALAAMALFTVALVSFACQPTFVEEFGAAINDDRASVTPRTASASEAAPATISNTMTTADAMRLLNSGYDEAAQLIRWEPLPTERKQLGFSANASVLLTRALLVAPFTQGERERYFLLTRTEAENCRSCTVTVGGAVYEKSDAGWQLVRETKAVTRVPAGDQFLNGKVVMIGVDKFGVLYRWRTANNGYAEEGERLVAETNDGLREIFSAITTANNESDCTPSYKCWSYKSTLTFVPREGERDYDLRMVTSGTRPNDEGLASVFEEVKTFRMVNGRYALWMR